MNARNQPRDVVLIGYSRGGILAHELTTFLKANRNLRNLHVLLLDPTAATFWGDKWPYGKASGVDIAINYDDDKNFVPFNASAGGAISDQIIPGYARRHFTPEGCGGQVFNDSCSHMAFPESFVLNRRFTEFLSQVSSSKDTGSFVPEDVPDSFDMKISAPNQHMFADLGGEINNNTFYGYGYVAGVVSVDVMAGAEGLGANTTIPLLGSAQTSLTRNGMAGSVNISILRGVNAGATTSVTASGIQDSVGIYGVSASSAFGKGENGGLVAGAGIGGEKVEFALGEDGHVIAIRFGNAASFVITNDDVMHAVPDLGQGFKDLQNVGQSIGGAVQEAAGHVAGELGKVLAIP